MKVWTYLALAGLAVTLLACSAAEGRKQGCIGAPSKDCAAIGARLDYGGWMVSEDSRVWKVRIGQSLVNAAPRHVGYMVQRRYRKVRGGPVFEMYVVTTLNRNEQVGHIDSVGRAIRYEPRRNLGFEEVPVGTGTHEESVGAIFDTLERVTLEPTTERRIAFEGLDDNGDGVLTWAGTAEQPDEVSRYGDRIMGADTNRDGQVDFLEFSGIETF